MEKPRQHTQEEMQEMFLETLRTYVGYWDRVEGQSSREKLDGLAFSFLNILDGTSDGVPAFDLYPDPHPTDKADCIENGENYWPDHEDRISLHGSNHLHDMWHKHSK